MADKIRIAILDDHQSIIDGYLFRLDRRPDMEVVGTAGYASDLQPLIREKPVDVLILDLNVPTAPNNPEPFPILQIIPELLAIRPELALMVISMFAERPLSQALVKAGISSYILKDDRESIAHLPTIVQRLMQGDLYFSEAVRNQLSKQSTPLEELLTPRQLEVLSLAAAHPDWSRSDLADHLKVSASTARNLLSNAYLRLDVPNLAAAIARARQLGLITPLASLKAP